MQIKIKKVEKFGKKVLTNFLQPCKIISLLKYREAQLAQLVEQRTAKVETAGSSPVYRFPIIQGKGADGNPALFFIQNIYICT